MRVIILLALLGTVLAAPKTPSRIVGGEPTTVDQYPYIANMQFYRLIWWNQRCGGTLITANAILSAAHCYHGDPWPSLWRVLLGTSFASSGGSTHSVSEIVLHPNYNHHFINNDVAIIRLSNPAVYGPNVQPARIAGPNYNLADGARVVTAGWGVLSSGGSSPEQLQHVEINIVNQELCAERYAYLKTLPGFWHWPDITDGMLCTGIQDVGGKDACQGDSGGPVAHDGDVIVGVVSWGYRCADNFYPGVNARVSAFSDWIAATA